MSNIVKDFISVYLISSYLIGVNLSSKYNNWFTLCVTLLYALKYLILIYMLLCNAYGQTSTNLNIVTWPCKLRIQMRMLFTNNSKFIQLIFWLAKTL